MKATADPHGPGHSATLRLHADRACGYAGGTYPASLPHVGAPLPLPRSGGWCLRRPIDATAAEDDATGPYPFLVCRDWSRLADDLAALAEAPAARPLVSVTAVTDPFAEADPATLASAFPDLCRIYKAHYVVDLAAGPPALDSHHRRNVRQGLRDTTVELAEPGHAWGDDWARLYGHLVARHAITGPAHFPPAALRQQLEIPGMLAARAIHEDRVVGMTLWALHEEYGYYHLGAYDETGYRVRAAYAMFAEVFAALAARGIRRVGLGAGAGTHAASAGLERFKRGWATGTADVLLGGRILDHTAYARLSSPRQGTGTTPFFPAYRAA